MDSKGNIQTGVEKFVDFKIFYFVLSLLVISTGWAFAQESIIEVQTDDNNYDEGDTIIISGKVTTVVGSTPVTLQIFLEANLLDIAQIEVAQDGNYSHTILAEGPLWKKQGDYLVKASYGDGNIAELEFSYTPKSKSSVTNDNFEVDAGNYGTFDVEYTIKGGTLENMIVDSNNFAMTIKIKSTDEGTITLDLPREFIDAKKQDGKDEVFIILIDSIETAYEELDSNQMQRTVAIDFEEGDSTIDIIGTHVVPEFGTITLMIIMIGIATTIIISKNKLQIKI